MARAERSRTEADLAWAESVDRRLEALARRRPRQIEFTADDGAKVVIGVFADDSVGVKVYDHTGAVTFSQTAT